ncbi:hypothetical protein [Sulfurimonas sp.]|uniref:hypothetical protein n=1 Tax=Sulfurimonas sp. TaxID=2022749 RepID=UPI0025D0C755|nr:hypothetical protein [Sulfurimonas sp.]
MKIAVECKSPLLQKSLEIFLASHLSSLKQSDIIVRDFKVLNDKKTFYISKDSDSDLLKPFSKSTLILALEDRYSNISSQLKSQTDSLSEDGADFSILEKRIDILTQEYKENILKAVRAFYEK